MRFAFFLLAAFAATLTLSLAAFNANDIKPKNALDTDTTTIEHDDETLYRRKNEGVVGEERVLGLEKIKSFLSTKVMSLISRLRAWFSRIFRFGKTVSGTSLESLSTSSRTPKISCR
ncbi:RxLR-like protein [Plasmopara halstedii]|uniref:RxLR-like protein n=1 Tax=Plasmopara halstedii TaxID=4781 RepID=A0A0P1B0D2_PLAHL|nr:RxLR-like protein [Plasmopara halstedii]CEG47479.1 RxLR-like protein [Plasmopara halstedii]|eukprot:XP_024583848.1 RxLR-like protein [Plasmopara halstedii]